MAPGGGETPSVTVDADVNFDTLTKGAATFYVFYYLMY